MAEITIKGRKIFFDEDDRDLVENSEYSWHIVDGYVFRSVYINSKKRQTQRLHRLIAERMFESVAGLQIDHVNGDRLDNRRSNLRLATHAQNQQNRTRRMVTNSSGFKGVSWYHRTGKWRARISINNRQRTLSYHDTAEEAARVYDRAALKLHGDFATTNFPKENYG